MQLLNMLIKYDSSSFSRYKKCTLKYKEMNRKFFQKIKPQRGFQYLFHDLQSPHLDRATACCHSLLSYPTVKQNHQFLLSFYFKRIVPPPRLDKESYCQTPPRICIDVLYKDQSSICSDSRVHF